MLASIQKINKVFPIEGADRIEGAEVLGWKCVVRKGTFKEGELCIYIEIDTIIPKYLLDESYSGDEVIRLRTVKMKGQISQGLVLPINILEKFVSHFDVYEDHVEFTDGTGEWKKLDINIDISESLNIKKYEKAIPANMQGIIKGNFPGFLRKTDEVRIQSEPKLLELLKGKPYYITTKLDGTSATYYKFEGKFGVCSRNLELKEDENNLYWKLARKYDIESWLPEGYAIQGEICGEGIQKNPLGLRGQDLFIFNVYDIKSGEYIWWFDSFINTDYLSFVPLEETGHKFNYTLEELLERAKGRYQNTNKNKEGIVVRSADQIISFKVVNNDYLLKDDE